MPGWTGLGLTELSDEELVLRARSAHAAGDGRTARQCAGVVVGRHLPRIRALVGAKVSRNDAEDVSSLVVERMLRLIYDKQEKPRSFRAMLTTLIGWCIADHYRGPRPDEPVDTLPEPAAEDQGIRELLDHDEADRLLAVLEPREREILVGLAEGRTGADLAAALGTSEGNVHVIAHRARAKLRASLPPEAAA
jgi:RNA polymerase sigma factor (sigma-70 family)